MSEVTVQVSEFGIFLAVHVLPLKAKAQAEPVFDGPKSVSAVDVIFVPHFHGGDTAFFQSAAYFEQFPSFIF